jgi:hypothetical protein
LLSEGGEMNIGIGTGQEVYTDDVLRTINGRDPGELNKRGLNVYTSTEVIGITGRGKDNLIYKGYQEVPMFGLGIIDRINIAQKCDAVFGVITGRMNRIAGLEWSVQRESKHEDRLELFLKQCKQIYEEYAVATEVKYKVIRYKMVREIMTRLPDCLPDLSNFNAALLRWKKRIEQMNDDASTEIEDWMHQPNSQDNFDDFTKKWVFDLHVHGIDGIWKEFVNGQMQNLYHLPGGTVIPLKDRYVSAKRMYAQIVPGMDPKIYFPDEMVLSTYLPTSCIGYGLIPLEALVNKIAETLFFDQRAAEMADGTKPPEKVAVFGGQKMPFGGLNDDEAPEIPLERTEESRLETLLNEPRKNAIRVLSGQGTPAILDLTRSETFSSQAERQRFIRESVAFVYNATNMEVNLSGSEGTSGRSTSESQEQIEKQKGTYPIIKLLESNWNYQLLPLRFGSGYIFQYKSGLDDKQQAELDQLMMASGTWSPNEIRMKRGDQPWGPEYDTPQQNQVSPPNGSQASPFNMRQM